MDRSATLVALPVARVQLILGSVRRDEIKRSSGRLHINPQEILTYALGFMPYLAALIAWMSTTLVIYPVAVYLIIPRPAAVIAALRPFTFNFNVLLGQNRFLTAGLIGLALVFIARGAWLSGIYLGLLGYKPQFGILFPLALLASRNWHALASAAVTSAALVVAAAMAFGYQAWPLFISSLVDRNSDLGQNHYPSYRFLVSFAPSA
jgi:hypothetical protein